MSMSILPSIRERDEPRFLDDCPNYELAVSRTRSHSTQSSAPYSATYDHIAPLNVHSRRTGQIRPLPRPCERYVYTYRLMANGAPIQFLVSVEPESGKPQAGKCIFRLAIKTNGIERSLCEPTTRFLKVDPRHLDFVVFIFPGKSGLPNGCLWSLRVWLRVNSTDHRIFGDDELWVAKDPDFHAIADASFARLRNLEPSEQVYRSYIGRALVIFTVRWQQVANNLYKYSLIYEANGVGDTLFEDFKLKVDGDPRKLTFLIVSIPSKSVPPGASHKLRVWVRTMVVVPDVNYSSSYAVPFNDSYIYQRIWKCDSFKIGSRLDFDALGAKMVMAFVAGIPETVSNPPPLEELSTTTSSPSLYTEKKDHDY